MEREMKAEETNDLIAITDDESAWSLELNDLKAMLKIDDSKELPLASSCCIYKVPPKLRKENEEAYTPIVVSIGPYHHNGDKRLKSMQELKGWYVNRFLKRAEKSKDYWKTLKNLEDEIRCSYSETIPMDSDEFLCIIFTDACFIIEFFLVNVGLEDSLVENLWQRQYIGFDLILLENQIPFFVLTHLFKLAFPNGIDGGRSLSDITYDFFERFFLPVIYPDEKADPKLFKISSNQVKHICDVLRTFYLPSPPPKRVLQQRTLNRSYSVSQLHESGMKFEAADKKSTVTELQYSEKVLKIPFISIQDWTETMLRNVVALEQCHGYLYNPVG